MRKSTVLAGLFVALSLSLIGLQGSGQQAKAQVEKGTQGATFQADANREAKTGEIIVKLDDNASQRDLRELNSRKDASVEENLPKSDVNLVDLPRDLSVREAIRQYENSPDIQYAEPNYILKPTKTPNDTYYSSALWGADNTGQTIGNQNGVQDADIDAPEAWDTTTGSASTVVAVIDQGVDISHPDLKSNIWTNPGEIAGNNVDDDGNGYVDDVHGWDFANDDASVYDPDPITGNGDEHGTHVAGTIAATGNNGIGVTGVNWQAKIMPLKFLGPNGGTTLDAVEAINYAVSSGVKISNNSWGGGGYSQSLHDAIARADAAGMLFVAAAGNDGSDNDATPSYPASYDNPNIISVAATDNKDALASFSNYGAKSVDLGAPGVDIASTLPNNSYAYYSGTSMATPQVTGVAALLKSNNSSLDNGQIKDQILRSAEATSSLQGKTLTGGRLNAASALGIKLTDLTVSTSPRTINFGQGVSLTGKLTSNGEALGGKSVILQKRSIGVSSFSNAGQATTASDGTYSLSSVKPTNKTYYRAYYPGDNSQNIRSSVSAATPVDVRVIASLYTLQTNLKLGRARTISGSVTPKHAGNVTVTIKRNGATIARKKASLNSDSRYSFRYKPGRPGNYAFFATYPKHTDHLGDRSRAKSFRVVR